jgi:transposase InsO family protein
MSEKNSAHRHDRWARFRFSVVGPLLSAPPARGELKAALAELAAKTWLHPLTQEPTRVGQSTIERWLYLARAERQDPLGALCRQLRQDTGQMRVMSLALRQELEAQYVAHKKWSYKLHADNLAVLVEMRPGLGRKPSYSTVRRYMKKHGLVRIRRKGHSGHPGEARAERRVELREVRDFEVEYVHGLWHSDFHHGDLKVLTAAGEWVTPLLVAFLDDRSRFVAHAQWYLAEGTEDFVHGLCQALLKQGLPRALMTDNGSAMKAAETTEGLLRLSIVHERTLSNSAYQNGKMEVFWGQVEGRLMAMLEGIKEDLTLKILNEATQAWVDGEYNRKVHSETRQTPLDRLLTDSSVGRPCVAVEALREAFTMEATRRQRRSDGTITVEGIRFELPSQWRFVEKVSIRYARWDLSYVLLIDPTLDRVLGRLYPVDKARNADAIRRPVQPVPSDPSTPPPKPGIAPLLQKLILEHRATGLPSAYLPKDDLQPFDGPTTTTREEPA